MMILMQIGTGEAYQNTGKPLLLYETGYIYYNHQPRKLSINSNSATYGQGKNWDISMKTVQRRLWHQAFMVEQVQRDH